MTGNDLSGKNRKSRKVAALLAIFLGGLGAHKFYLGRVSGLFYLLFTFTLIPWIIGFIEGIAYFCVSDSDFQRVYLHQPAQSSLPVCSIPASGDARTEISDIRRIIGELTDRLNVLEKNLAVVPVGQAQQSVPAEVVIVKSEPEPAPLVEKPAVLPHPVVPSEKKPLSETIEQVLGAKWFNKLGILAVVIGVALLVALTFTAMGAVGKVVIGYLSGFALLWLGVRIEKREGFAVYGRTLIGGSWAILYFTTFALHHIPDIRLVKDPFLGMALLLLVSLAQILHVYHYRSQAASGFSYLLVFMTLMLTPVAPYTMAAAAITAVSLVFFMCKERWFKFGLYGIAMTYLTYLSWFLAKPAQLLPKSEFVIAAGFLLLYWLIFVAAVFLIRDVSDSRPKPQKLELDIDIGIRDFTAIINAVCAGFLATMLLYAGYTQYWRPLLLLVAAVYVLFTLISFMRNQRSLAITHSLVALLSAAIFLADKYSGYSLTVVLLVLAQIVLLAGMLAKEPYWRVCGFGLLMFLLGKLLLVDAFAESSQTVMDLNTRRWLFLFAFLMYALSHWLYSRLKNKNLTVRQENSHPVLISYSYPAIYAMGTWLDLPKALTAPCWMILGVILLQMGVSRNDHHRRLQGHVLAIGAFIRLLMSNMTIDGGIGPFTYRLLTCAPVLLLLVYCFLLLQEESSLKILGPREKKIPWLYAYMIFSGLLVFLAYELPKYAVASGWAGVTLVYALLGLYRRRLFYLTMTSLAAIAAMTRAAFINVWQAKYLAGAVAGNMIHVFVTLFFLYVSYGFYYKIRQGLPVDNKGYRLRRLLYSPRIVLGLSSAALITFILKIKLSGAMLTVGLVMEGLVLFLSGFMLKEKSWRLFGQLLLLFVLLKTFLVDMPRLNVLNYILSLIALGFVLLFVSYMYTKYKDKFKNII